WGRMGVWACGRPTTPTHPHAHPPTRSHAGRLLARRGDGRPGSGEDLPAAAAANEDAQGAGLVIDLASVDPALAADAIRHHRRVAAHHDLKITGVHPLPRHGAGAALIEYLGLVLHLAVAVHAHVVVGPGAT